MKWTVFGLIFLFQMRLFASSSIIAMEQDLFTMNLFCSLQSDLGIATGDTLDVTSQHNKARAFWFKKQQEFQRFNGEVIDSTTDPIVQKFAQMTGQPLFGFKFNSPSETDPSILRLVVFKESNHWMPSYLILSIPSDDIDNELEETVILNQNAQCKYYDNLSG